MREVARQLGGVAEGLSRLGFFLFLFLMLGLYCILWLVLSLLEECHVFMQNKAPPHVEGDLLRQGTQSIFGRKSWKKYFFIVSGS